MQKQIISVIILSSLSSSIGIIQESSLIQQANFKSEKKIISELTAQKEQKQPQEVVPGNGRRNEENKA